MPEAQPPHSRREGYDFLEGGGEMGALMRAFDWSSSLLGPVERWPQSLRTSVSICLNSRFAILIWWGPDLVMLYNDAYSQIIGVKHPAALGHPGRECWPEIWQIIDPMLDGVLRGGDATWSSDLLLMLERNGYPEECYFTFSYSPIRDETGGIAGVFTPVADTTERVIHSRRMNTLRDLAGRAGGARDTHQACAGVAETLAANPQSIPFASIYLFNEGLDSAALEATAGIEVGAPAARPVVRVSELPAPLSAAILATDVTIIEDLADFCGPLPCGAWSVPARTGLVLPIVMPGEATPTGFVLAGANPHKRVDAAYRTFFELAAGHISSVVAAARTYEQERRRAEALAEIDRAKTTFFSNVSHEFRTPLTLLLGPLEDALANRHGVLPMGAAASLATSHRNALRLLRLVNTLLDFSRIEAHRVRAFYEPVDLAALTADLASNFRSLCDKAGLQLDVDCSAFRSNGSVYVDREMWEKIVLNLLSNAFKFTLEGRIEVLLREQIGEAILTVRDTGVGIPPEDLPHMFERFHRIENTRGRTHEGTGIGLALVQELVKLHGGAVSVESAIGKGSTFRVTIPLGKHHLNQARVDHAHDADHPTSAAFISEASRWLPDEFTPDAPSTYEGTLYESGPALPDDKKDGRIVWADDNADMRAYVRRLLGARFQLYVVADGAAALKAAKAHAPDLILSDVMMPGMDGFALLGEIRSDAILCNTPVILLSARAGEEARIEGLRAGADDYLTKPFSSRELLVLVQAHVRLSRLRREKADALQQAGRDARLLASIVEFSDDAIISKDLNGVITSWNRGAERLFGYTPQEVIGRSVTILMPPDRLDEEPRILASLRRGQRVDHFETVRVRKDGIRLNISLTISPVKDAEGRIVGASKVARDITERIRQEAALKQANSDLQQFAHSAAHDLQEPLRTLTAYSQLLELRFSEVLGDGGGEILRYIIQASIRMHDLLHGLRIYAQISGADSEPAREIDAAAIVRNVLENLAALIRENGATVEFADLPRVHMPAFQLEQVFQNLIGNAIRYRGSAPPHVRIAAAMRGEEWVFSVRDNGIGIAPEFHRQIFGIFRRLHSQVEYPGSGMGLAICQRSIERCGGRIWIESAPGEGSTFFFTIPLADASQRAGR